MNYNPFSLSGKKILVTGASSGIGKATAIECSKLGATIIITGRNEFRLQETLSQLDGANNKSIIFDFTNNGSLVEFCLNLPLLDGIVMCAGITKTIPAKFNSRSIIDEIFNTNTFFNISLTGYLLKYKYFNNNASIIFISSVASNRPYIGNSLYSASKGAINSYSKVLAVEFANKKIRVNTILPGIVKTKMVDEQVFTSEDMAKENDRIPLGFGNVLDVARSCVYLLSDASKWVTGTELIIDGGQSLI